MDAREDQWYRSPEEAGANMETESLYGKPGQNLDLVFLKPTEGEQGAEARPGAAEDEDNVFTSPPTPPDGGYGWAVVLGAFFVNVLCDGTCFSFAIFFNELGNYYNEPESTVAWVGSSLVGCYLLVGPFAGALADRYSCRAVCIAGAIITTLAFILSVFAPNIYVLILLYGVLGGIGMGLSYLPSVVIVGLYFEKRRATATGIAVCGSGVGCFVIAPLMTTLLQAYGWKGAFLISAGIMLNSAVCGALFRPLKAHSRRSREQKTKVIELEPAAPLFAGQSASQLHQPSGRRHLDSANLSEISSHYGSNKSVTFVQSKVTIMEAVNEVSADDVLGSGAVSRPAPPQRHRVISLNEDALGGGNAATTRLLRLISAGDDDEELDEEDDDSLPEAPQMSTTTAALSTSSTSSIRPLSPSIRKNLEVIPESKKELGRKTNDDLRGGNDNGADEGNNNDAATDDENEATEVIIDGNSGVNLTKNENNSKVTLEVGRHAGKVTARVTAAPTTTTTRKTSSPELSSSGARLKENGEETVKSSAASKSGVNIGFRPLDDLDVRALRLADGPKKLVKANRETATVATGLTNYFLVENQHKKDAVDAQSNYWKKKDLASPEGSQLTLHAIPTNLSLKWIESFGSIPHPEVVLKYQTPALLQRTTSSVSKASLQSKLPPLAKKDIFYSRSIASVNQYQSMRSGIARVDVDDVEEVDEEDDGRDGDTEAVSLRKKSECCLSCCHRVRSLLDCSLLKSPTFVIFSTSGMLVMMAIPIVYMFLMKYGESQGLKQEKTQWFISIIGISNSVFRLLVGLIADAPWADVVHFTTASLIIGGLGTILLPLVCTTFVMISVYCCCFALSIACYVSLRSIVMVELFGLEKLTNSFGISLLFQGVACLMGPPIAGLMFEKTGSYTVTFVCTGLCFLMSATLHGPIKKIAKCEAECRRRRSDALTPPKSL